MTYEEHERYVRQKLKSGIQFPSVVKRSEYIKCKKLGRPYYGQQKKCGELRIAKS